MVNIIDFGLSKYYMNKSGHIPEASGKNVIGTLTYCSLAAHMGKEQSRRDDLESLGHVLIYFLRRGKLPWSCISEVGASKEERYENVKNKKMNTSFKELCEGLPDEFISFMKYCRSIEFSD